MRDPSISLEARPLPNGNKKNSSHWASPGSVAFDFRSDTVTSPTCRMLQAISETTLGDDCYQEDPTTNEFEAFVASLTGKETGLFVMSGTMGNQVSIRTLLQGPPHSLVADHRSHVVEWEAGGIASWSQALCKPATPANGIYLTLEDVQKAADLRDDPHACPTRLICLENTVDGCVVPLKECQRIRAWAKENNIHMHLDGARLWEAVATGAGTLKEYCACFDTVTMCFSKGLGAPIGSIIVCSEELHHRALWVRKSMGGGTRQLGVLTAAARVAVEETFFGGKLLPTHQKAKRVASIWTKYGGKVTAPVETNMVWLDLDEAGITAEEFAEAGRRIGINLLDGRLVIHYQICEEALEGFDKLARKVLAGEGGYEAYCWPKN